MRHKGSHLKSVWHKFCHLNGPSGGLLAHARRKGADLLQSTTRGDCHTETTHSTVWSPQAVTTAWNSHESFNATSRVMLRIDAVILLSLVNGSLRGKVDHTTTIVVPNKNHNLERSR